MSEPDKPGASQKSFHHNACVYNYNTATQTYDLVPDNSGDACQTCPPHPGRGGHLGTKIKVVAGDLELVTKGGRITLSQGGKTLLEIAPQTEDDNDPGYPSIILNCPN